MDTYDALTRSLRRLKNKYPDDFIWTLGRAVIDVMDEPKELGEFTVSFDFHTQRIFNAILEKLAPKQASRVNVRKS